MKTNLLETLVGGKRLTPAEVAALNNAQKLETLEENLRQKKEIFLKKLKDLVDEMSRKIDRVPNLSLESVFLYQIKIDGKDVFKLLEEATQLIRQATSFQSMLHDFDVTEEIIVDSGISNITLWFLAKLPFQERYSEEKARRKQEKDPEERQKKIEKQVIALFREYSAIYTGMNTYFSEIEREIGKIESQLKKALTEIETLAEFIRKHTFSEPQYIPGLSVPGFKHTYSVPIIVNYIPDCQQAIPIGINIGAVGESAYDKLGKMNRTAERVHKILITLTNNSTTAEKTKPQKLKPLNPKDPDFLNRILTEVPNGNIGITAIYDGPTLNGEGTQNQTTYEFALTSGSKLIHRLLTTGNPVFTKYDLDGKPVEFDAEGRATWLEVLASIAHEIKVATGGLVELQPSALQGLIHHSIKDKQLENTYIAEQLQMTINQHLLLEYIQAMRSTPQGRSGYEQLFHTFYSFPDGELSFIFEAYFKGLISPRNFAMALSAFRFGRPEIGRQLISGRISQVDAFQLLSGTGSKYDIDLEKLTLIEKRDEDNKILPAGSDTAVMQKQNSVIVVKNSGLGMRAGELAGIGNIIDQWNGNPFFHFGFLTCVDKIALASAAEGKAVGQVAEATAVHRTTLLNAYLAAINEATEHFRKDGQWTPDGKKLISDTSAEIVKKALATVDDLAKKLSVSYTPEEQESKVKK